MCIPTSIRSALAVMTGLALAATSPAIARTPAGVAGTLSVIPGLGQGVEGNALEGLGWFSATVAGFGFRTSVGLNIWMYNMYDAWRDARPQNGKYRNTTWSENFLAAFNPLNLLDPVGTPLLASYGAIPGIQTYRGRNFTFAKPVGTAFIGWGEEAFFRGFLFPAFSDLTSSTMAGALASSALFGLTHAGYSPRGKAVVGIFGLLQALQLHLNRYDLRKNIFTHSWTDFFLLPKGVSSVEKGCGEGEKPPGPSLPGALGAGGLGFRIHIFF